MKDLKISISGRRISNLILFVLFFFVSIPVLEAQEYRQVKALKGDGIYSLLRRNGLPPARYLEEFIRLNKKNLGKDNSLYAGRSYKLPVVDASPSKTSRSQVSSAVPAASPDSGGAKGNKIKRYELFGSKYRDVVQQDDRLSGAVLYLVSGHGGPDPGAVGRYGSHQLCEDEYAYDVTLRLARRLLEHGATVYMIVRDKNDGIRDVSFLRADKDERCYPDRSIPRSQVARLRQRKDAVNTLYGRHKGAYQRMVVIHLDSRSRGQNIDVFFYHYGGSTSGRRLALNLQQTFREKYNMHQPNRGYRGTVSDRNLYMLKYSYPPAVFIELGNINHRRDQQRFMIIDNRQALANWLTEGLIRDYAGSR
ncbi:MAG: N-acetylmuramoyl-L-alanine amidase [Mangrovibacterium sp.]